MAKALLPHEHNAINVREYPGTRQMCVVCDTPTGRCEEDAWHDDIDDGEGGPYCERCGNFIDGRVKAAREYTMAECDEHISELERCGKNANQEAMKLRQRLRDLTEG